jgi:PAS domain S-box-containing protein
MAQTLEQTGRTVSSQPRILLADAHADMRQYLTRLLSEHYEIDAAADAEAALALARKHAPDLVVADVTTKSAGDCDLLCEFRRDEWGSVPIILYSPASDEESCVNAIEAGANDYLITPFSERQLLALIRAQLRVAQMRRESIQSLRLSEERFRTLKTTMTEGVWVSAPNGQVDGELAWWWEKLTGQTPEQYAGFGFLDVVHPEDKPRVIEIRQESLRNTTAFEAEFRVRQRDGSYTHVRNQGAPVLDGDGNVREWVGTIIDIDADKRAEEALRASEERHRTFVAMTALAVWSTAPDAEVSKDYGLAQLTGQTPEQSQGFGWLDALHPDDKPWVLENWRHALRDGTPFDCEYKVRRKDGTYSYVRDQGVPLRNADGSVREWMGTVIDIDNQKRAEEALRASEEQFRANFEMAGIGQVQTDPKTGRYLRVNERFCCMVGYSSDELSTMTYLDIIHPEDRAAGMAALLGLLRGETDKHTIEKRYVCKDGSIFWGLVTSTLIHDAHRRPLRTITMIEDVTERRQSEALAQCQKRALEMVAQGASLADVLDFVILAVEKQANVDLRASMLVLDQKGKHLRLVAAPSLPESYRQAVAVCPAQLQSALCALAVSEKRPVIVPDLAASPEWSEIADMLAPYGFRSMWAMPIIGSEQKPLGSFCLYFREPRTPRVSQQTMIENVTQTIALAIERKQTEADRENLLILEKAAREQAEAANRMKDEFLAVVSHELRTPLNAINGWTYMLLSGALDVDAQSRALQSIQRQVSTQCQLIDDLLDVARIVSGNLRLERKDVDPSKVITAALDVVRPAAEAKQIELVADFDAAAMTVSADPERLQQVIWNLLSNAIKFTPQRGRVEIRSRHVDSNIEIAVTDTGQGISGDFLPYVFDRFRQADVSTTRTDRGIGLGLAIARHLIELHGGTIWAKSEGRGKGAKFALQLPARAVLKRRSNIVSRKKEPEARPDKPAEIKEVLKGVRVLVVEDNLDDREVLVAELAHYGATVSAFACSAEALTGLEQLRPDVLVADIGMPGEDGYSLVRKIRKRSRDRGGLTPAIALTAYTGDANRQRALHAGYQKHMTKPADPNELATTIVRLARGDGP